MLLHTVRRTIRRHKLATPTSRVLLAVSGGGDSVALAHLLDALRRAGDLTIAGVVHFNHQLRDEADEEERFCRSLAHTLGYPFVSDREDVGARAAREHLSIEHAARNARHDFFAKACAELSADVVALGHTRDDQAETYLLRLMRGAGARGLSGMHPKNGLVIRPLIDCRRAELRAFLSERTLPFLEDASNADVAIPRNRVRAEVIPLLESRFNPGVVDALAAQAELARDEWRWMQDELRSRGLEAEEAIGRPRTWSLTISALRSAPRALRRVALWTAMRTAAQGRTVSLRHVHAVLRMVESSRHMGCVDAPGHVVERIGGRVVLRSGVRSRDITHTAGSFCYSLSVPGEVSVPERGCIVSAELVAGAGLSGALVSAAVGSRARAVLNSEGWAAPLSVRSRRPGDRFRPFGLAGQKKLQDFLVDRKVARADRDQVPLVVDANDRIVWVAGHEIDESFRVIDGSQPVLILTLRPVNK